MINDRINRNKRARIKKIKQINLNNTIATGCNWAMPVWLLIVLGCSWMCITCFTCVVIFLGFVLSNVNVLFACFLVHLVGCVIRLSFSCNMYDSTEPHFETFFLTNTKNKIDPKKTRTIIQNHIRIKLHSLNMHSNCTRWNLFRSGFISYYFRHTLQISFRRQEK